MKELILVATLLVAVAGIGLTATLIAIGPSCRRNKTPYSRATRHIPPAHKREIR